MSSPDESGPCQQWGLAACIRQSHAGVWLYPNRYVTMAGWVAVGINVLDPTPKGLTKYQWPRSMRSRQLWKTQIPKKLSLSRRGGGYPLGLCATIVRISRMSAGQRINSRRGLSVVQTRHEAGVVTPVGRIRALLISTVRGWGGGGRSARRPPEHPMRGKPRTDLGLRFAQRRTRWIAHFARATRVDL